MKHQRWNKSTTTTTRENVSRRSAGLGLTRCKRNQKHVFFIFKITSGKPMAPVTMVTVSGESVSSSCCICHLRPVLLIFSAFLPRSHPDQPPHGERRNSPRFSAGGVISLVPLRLPSLTPEAQSVNERAFLLCWKEKPTPVCTTQNSALVPTTTPQFSSFLNVGLKRT